MNKKLLVILTSVFAAVAVLLTVLSVVNFTKKSDDGSVIDEKTAGLVLADGVEADSASAKLDGVESNAMKAQAQYPEGILEELKQA